MSNPVAIAIVGKALEELGELISALGRSLIQGIDEREPTTGRLNRDWVEDETADVRSALHHVENYFRLDRPRVTERMHVKMAHLAGWHDLLRSMASHERIALTEAATTFRAYEELHKAKGTEEGNAKAEANRALAEVCERALG